ncbi:hypothetical protein [Flavobacterium sp. ASW18X]|uniref:hypothetical protein n=1 Tax=Flavobacterium sp. ASW18X TaxID=2572595 RepID=UPI0010AE2F9B|nr:hypothetical protein [Flavobacterium sp. ASW18X]TKD61839.1 hypothetical protein FBT53_10700 [Flavobacterium sp. ASW18X]
MKKVLGLLTLGILANISCGDKDNTFVITNDSIGKLDRISLVRDLELIYADDSIVKDTFATRIQASNKKIKVFEKGGKHLLTLTPTDDSIPKIENIQIMDPRYTTEEGIGLSSTFKDIQAKYTIKKIVNATNNIIIFINESNLYFTISKEELPESLRYNRGSIEAVQIPDEAKIKYLMLAWGA